MTKNQFNGPYYVGVLGKFCYPGMQERHLPASIEHFNQHNELISCQPCFREKKVTIFVFSKILVSNIFEKNLEICAFSKKSY